MFQFHYLQTSILHIIMNNLTLILTLTSPINLCLDKERILFGYPEKNKLSFNKKFILLIAKCFIFKCAKEKRQLNSIEFQKIFQKIYDEQMYLTKTNCEFEKFSRLCPCLVFVVYLMSE